MSTSLIYKQLAHINDQACTLRSVLDDCASMLTGAIPPWEGKAAPPASTEPSGFLPTVVFKHDDISEALSRAVQLADYLRMSIQGPPQPESSIERALTQALIPGTRIG